MNKFYAAETLQPKIISKIGSGDDDINPVEDSKDAPPLIAFDIEASIDVDADKAELHSINHVTPI